MGQPPVVTEEPGLVGMGEYLGCFDSSCDRPAVLVAVFPAPSEGRSGELVPAVTRFCSVHEHDAFVLAHSWTDDPDEVLAVPVEAWDVPGGVRDQLFSDGLNGAEVVTRAFRAG